VGGAAESISAISMAAKNKMDLTIAFALGSSIQIALFVSPLLVILVFSWGLSK
jgi:Ca2+:H+ antiporter